MILNIIPKIIKQTLIFEFTYQICLTTINLKQDKISNTFPKQKHLFISNIQKIQKLQIVELSTL